MLERGLGRAADPAELCDPRTVHPERVAHGRELLLDDDVYFDLAETFRALADSSRVKIIYSLLQQELCVCDLAAVVGMSESAVSQHLRVLRNLRLVKTRREGKLMYYLLDDAHVRRLLDLSLTHLSDRARHGAAAQSGAGLEPAGAVAVLWTGFQPTPAADDPTVVPERSG